VKADHAGVTAPAARTGGELVIEEPPPPLPPPPTLAVPVAPPAPLAEPRRPRPRPEERPSDDSSLAAAAKSTEAPLLESVVAPTSEAGLRERLQKLNTEIDQFRNQYQLNSTERRTLEDARTFLSQSMQALTDHDLLRADQLAKKAAQLLAALEPEQ
jgi:hypothetical protein